MTAWRELGEALGVDDASAAASVGDDLMERHQEPARHYHGMEHILDVLGYLDTLNARNPTTQLAAFFHDAIYDPTASDNEERSAVLATDRLPPMGVAAAVTADVARIIRATATHEMPTDPGDADGAFLDADMAILGASSDGYAQYAEDIRREYSHLDDEVYRTGRRGVLEGFLGRDVLYFTSDARWRWEASARANVKAEIAQLS